MRFSIFSVVFVYSNSLYSSEQKPGNTTNYQFFEKVDFVFLFLKDPVYICEKNGVKALNFNKSQI